jgi:hypothetical protein
MIWQSMLGAVTVEAFNTLAALLILGGGLFVIGVTNARIGVRPRKGQCR